MSIEAVAEWPRYQSHKRVYALKIAGVEEHRITFADPAFEPIDCPAEMFARGSPQSGSYLVEYEGDGYRAFSPGPAFEEGYRPCEDGMSFGGALDLLKAGKRVARAGWNGKGMWLVMIRPGGAAYRSSDGVLFAMQDCIGLKTAGGTMQPGWNASTPDMLADDWAVIEG